MNYMPFLEKKLVFSFLLKADKPGVYALVNEKHKKAYIVSSNNVIKSLADQISQLGNKIHPIKELKRDRKYLKFTMLEYCHSNLKTPLKLKYIEEYKNKGYSIYNIERLPRYTVRKTILEDGVLEVQLVSGGKRITPIKGFRSPWDADYFISTTSIIDMLIMVANDSI